MTNLVFPPPPVPVTLVEYGAAVARLARERDLPECDSAGVIHSCATLLHARLTDMREVSIPERTLHLALFVLDVVGMLHRVTAGQMEGALRTLPFQVSATCTPEQLAGAMGYTYRPGLALLHRSVVAVTRGAQAKSELVVAVHLAELLSTSLMLLGSWVRDDLTGVLLQVLDTYPTFSPLPTPQP